MTRTRNVRNAFTLTELLVAMAVIIVLAGIAAMVVPGAVAQDRTTDGAALTRQYLMIAKNRAARDNLPRGLRLIVAPDPEVPTKNPLWVTVMQEIEAPEVMVPNILQTTTSNIVTPPAPGVTPSPYAQVVYDIGNGTTGPQGAIINRHIYLRNLNSDQLASFQQRGALLGIPEFNGYWARIWSIDAAGELQLIDRAGTAIQDGRISSVTAPTSYPDDYMGASTNALSYRFGIYAPPQPLLAAQTLPLPKNICVDLTVSSPGPVGGDYDILFAPNGQIINGIGRPAVQGQMFLWVRDYTKAANPLVQLAPGPPITYDMNVFRTAGEQQIVSLKAKSGSLGVFPVLWPLEGTGQYAAGQDAYSFARQGANGP